MRTGLAAGLLCAAALLVSGGPAQAVVTVFGDSFAAVCSRAARAQRADDAAIQLCTTALGEDVISKHDLAATYVNRATMRMHRQEWRAAVADLDQALSIDSTLGETRVNRGAAYVALGRAGEAVSEIDAGLALKSEEPEKAYYNRGLAHEQLDDVRSAYFDYLKAAEIAPKWSEPKLALARFHVEPKR